MFADIDLSIYSVFDKDFVVNIEKAVSFEPALSHSVRFFILLNFYVFYSALKLNCNRNIHKAFEEDKNN